MEEIKSRRCREQKTAVHLCPLPTGMESTRINCIILLSGVKHRNCSDVDEFKRGKRSGPLKK
jgi:hypothetical protein